MWKKPAAAQPELCLVMDSASVPLARGYLESPPDAQNMQIRIVDGSMEDVLSHEIFQVVTEDRDQPAKLGRILLRRNNLIVLDPLRALGDEVRQNLRMPVAFESFVYPLSGGRVPVRANDLSCGGIAFFTNHAFADGEEFEIVIPITSPEPLILKARILRQRPSQELETLYAAKFVDMLDEEEHRVREAVFNVQLRRKN